MGRTEMVLDLLEKTNVMLTLVEGIANEIGQSVPGLSKESCLEIAAGLDYAVVLNHMIHAYDGFSDGELQEVLDFYDSAAGRKMVNNLPQQMVALGAAVRSWKPVAQQHIQAAVNAKLSQLS